MVASGQRGYVSTDVSTTPLPITASLYLKVENICVIAEMIKRQQSWRFIYTPVSRTRCLNAVWICLKYSSWSFWPRMSCLTDSTPKDQRKPSAHISEVLSVEASLRCVAACRDGCWEVSDSASFPNPPFLCAVIWCILHLLYFTCHTSGFFFAILRLSSCLLPISNHLAFQQQINKCLSTFCTNLHSHNPSGTVILEVSSFSGWVQTRVASFRKRPCEGALIAAVHPPLPNKITWKGLMKCFLLDPTTFCLERVIPYRWLMCSNRKTKYSLAPEIEIPLEVTEICEISWDGPGSVPSSMPLLVALARCPFPPCKLSLWTACVRWPAVPTVPLHRRARQSGTCPTSAPGDPALSSSAWSSGSSQCSAACI